MKWTTAISTKKDGELYIRGEALSKLTQERTYTEAAFLVLSGRLPSDAEKTLFDMILVSTIEHGVETPTGYIPRVSASVGNPMNAVIAAGMLATGDYHGGAIEKAAEYIRSEQSAEEIVAGVIAKKARLLGFGHKIYKDVDPRAEALLSRALELNVAVKEIEKARALGVELEKQSGKKLPLNVDMAIATIISAFGFDPRIGMGLFGFARVPSMMAHAIEELTNEKPYRRFEEADTEYTGPTPQS